MLLMSYDTYWRLIGHAQAADAAKAGENSFKSFMVAVQRCASSVAIVQQVCTEYRCMLQLILPLDHLHSRTDDQLLFAVFCK